MAEISSGALVVAFGVGVIVGLLLMYRMLKVNVVARFESIDAKLATLSSRGEQFMATAAEALEALRAEVARNTAVDQSAITLLQGLAQKLDEAVAVGDASAISQIAADLRASTDALAAAVVQNTPAETPPAEQTGEQTQQQ